MAIAPCNASLAQSVSRGTSVLTLIAVPEDLSLTWGSVTAVSRVSVDPGIAPAAVRLIAEWMHEGERPDVVILVIEGQAALGSAQTPPTMEAMLNALTAAELPLARGILITAGFRQRYERSSQAEGTISPP